VATQTVSGFDADLKDVYGGTIVELLNNEAYMIEQVEKQSADAIGAYDGRGRRLVWAVHTGRNRPNGFAVTDGGSLAVAGVQTDLTATTTIKGFDAAIELTDQVMRQSRGGNTTAFASALSREMDGAMTDMRLRINRMVYGTGDGLLASCTATQSARTISVDSGQYINAGDTVDVLTRSDGTVRQAGAVVTAVTYTGIADGSTQANADITLDTSVSVTATEGIYLAGDRSNETDGLRNITSTSRRLHSIDSSSVGVWDGNVNAAGWVNISEDLLMQQAQKIRQRTGRNVEKFLTTYGVQRRLANQYQNQRRWVDAGGLTVEGGYQSIMVSAGGKQTPVIADTDCPNGFVFSLNMEPFAWAELGKPGWLEPPDGGSIFHLKDSSTAGRKVATWQAWVIWYATMICSAPNREGQISQLKDDVPIPHV
jgi:hypothetical protein